MNFEELNPKNELPLDKRETVSPRPEAPQQKPADSIIDDPEVLGMRSQKITALRTGFDVIKESYTKTKSALLDTYSVLGLTGTTETPPSQILSEEQMQEEERKIVEAEANYPGDWTLLLRERLLHPSTHDKMATTLTKHRESYPNETPGLLDKKENFRSFQEEQAQGFTKRVGDRFQATGIGQAIDYGQDGKALGVAQHTLESPDDASNFIHSGAVFYDGVTNENVPLTARQKNIIEAHEKGHAVRKFSGPMADEIRQVLDPDVIASRDVKQNYIFKADEIVERMSQLKNYYGFKANETFTVTHLKHARDHYVKDTGLDNDIQVFLDAISPRTEKQFLKVMNEYPI